MKLSDTLKKYKRILAALMIFLLVTGIELGFNYPSIKDGYDWLDISGTMGITTLEDREWYEFLLLSEEGLYIKQLRVQGLFRSGADYQIETVEKNGFGKEETHTYSDHLSFWNTEFYTNLGKNVTSLKIRIPVSCLEEGEVPSVSVSNQFELNKYRIFFFAAVFLLLYCIIWEEFFRRKPEWYFALYALIFGCFLISSGQTQINSWDEEVHFRDTFRMASGRVVEWNEATDVIVNASMMKCNTKTEYAWLRKVMDEKGLVTTYVETQQGTIFSYSHLPYLPSALFLKAGILLRLPFTQQFMLGKMGNLLAYIFLMFWAIRLAKRRKLFLTFIAMMPTCLFLAGSYTYDSVGFACVTFACVLWANEVFTEQVEYRKGPVLLSLLLFAVGCSAKIIYMPLALAVILMPQLKVEQKKHRVALGAGILAVCMIVMLTFLGPLLVDLVNGTLTFSDPRGGDTSMMGQLLSMEQHVGESIKMLIRDMFSLDNFRNSGDPALNNFFFGNLMFLNYYRLGVMTDKWCLLLLPVLTILLLYRDEDTENGTAVRTVKRSQVLFAAGLIGLVVVLIWLSMYLAFTPVGEDQILGVQPRYYLPLLYLTAVLVQNKNIFVQIPKKTVIRLSLSVALIFETVSIFDFLLKNRLF